MLSEGGDILRSDVKEGTKDSIIKDYHMIMIRIIIN